MYLPNAENVVIAKKKITEYLLSDVHPIGRTKANYLKRFGFELQRWEILREALRKLVVEFEVSSVQSSPHGTRYVIDGNIQTPDGRNPLIRTIWVIDKEKINPHFVTAFPL
ncbi:MAG: hypothetical protein HY960_01655 [Ignavibacteriae bacterium]|nr:hypothetical protein [Ignavibacteriota bacterium]